MPAHPSHPALQPLHTHLNKFFLKTPWERGKVTKKLFTLRMSLTLAILKFSHLPVTCLSGNEGIGIADPNLSRSLSYSQSKCLYLWLTGRFVVCKPLTRSYQHCKLCHARKLLLYLLQNTDKPSVRQMILWQLSFNTDSLKSATGCLHWVWLDTRCSSSGHTSWSLSWDPPPHSRAGLQGKPRPARLLQSEHDDSEMYQIFHTLHW